MYLDDIALNQEIDIPPVVIEKAQMMEFARQYDPIPLHCDEEYAKTTRYGQLIAPGVMAFMAVWAKFIGTGFLGDELTAGKSTKIEWHRPVYAGDVLTGKAKVTRITRRNAYNGVAEITVEVFNQRGEKVITNVTEPVLKYRA